MNIIHSNPYRIAGILSNATEKELQKQKAKIKAFSKVGKELSFDIDFSFLKNIERNEQTISKAFSNIQQNNDKVSNALFWFLKTSPFDETAFTYLINGNREKAIEIWTKVTENKEVNSKNFSAFNNLGTLKLISESVEEIREGIQVKIKLIESEFFENFVHSVADQTFIINNKTQSEKLIDELLLQFKNQYSNSDTLDLFSKCNGNIKKYLSNKFTEEPIHNIESRIASAKRLRVENMSDTFKLGFRLFNDSKKELKELKTLLGVADLHYKMIADSLAKEVMQCGIDYFEIWKDQKDPSKETLKLLKYAKSIAVGTQTKDRVKENSNGIEDWAETAPIQADIIFITKRLELFQDLTSTCSNAEQLLRACSPKLLNIKNLLGSTNELYRGISDAVYNNAQEMIISLVNSAQDLVQSRSNPLLKNLHLTFDPVDFSSVISSALKVSLLLGKLDLSPSMRARYRENHSALTSMASQLGIRTSPQRSTPKPRLTSKRTPPPTNEGCYIATMTYGDYNHPQVLELRKFRDDVLRRSITGRAFIKCYYNISPYLVEILKDYKRVNKVIRQVLDGFIKAIKP